MKIQVHLTAAAINLKRLAATLLALLLRWIPPWSPFPRLHPRAGLEARATDPIAEYTRGTDHFFNDPTQQRAGRGSGRYLFDRFPESERTFDRELGANRQPTPLEIEKQFAPRVHSRAPRR
jgi:hypothetical protein